jgi:hypothetical protein
MKYLRCKYCVKAPKNSFFLEKFCDEICHNKSIGNVPDCKGHKNIICLFCGKQFGKIASSKSEYCSKECWLTYQTINRLNVPEKLRNGSAVVGVVKYNSPDKDISKVAISLIGKAISGIYAIIHKISKKAYIGSAINVEKRWSEHKHDLYLNDHDNDYLQKSWNKYGEKAFECVILEEVLEHSKLLEREQYYIDEFKTYEDWNGYNIRKVAESNFGLKHKPETLIKMCKAQAVRRELEKALDK